MGLEHFLNEWNECDYLAGKKITIKNHEKIIEGEYSGIDDQGNLLLKVDGNITTLYSGDTSIASDK